MKVRLKRRRLDKIQTGKDRPVHKASWRLAGFLMERIQKRPYHTRDGGLKRSRYEGGTTKVILPIFEPSGLLELESHNKEGVQLKHVEPPDAISPKEYWENLNVPIKKRKLFQIMVYLKGEKAALNEYNLDSKSSYIVGRAMMRSLNSEAEDKDSKEVVVADIRIPEETCSKQHCVVQFRKKEGELKAYVMDLDSANGTLLNGVVLPQARYVELRSGDLLIPSSGEDSQYEIVFLSV